MGRSLLVLSWLVLLGSQEFVWSQTLLATEDKVFLKFEGLPKDNRASCNVVDDVGRVISQDVDLNRVPVLMNDIMNDDSLSCVEDKATATVDSYTGTRISFEEVAQTIGLTVQHRKTSPQVPHCALDWETPTISNATLRIEGDQCVVETTTGGLAIGDYNKDGLDDIFFTVFEGGSILYRNNGDGTFTDVSQSAGIGPTLYGNGAGWFDADADGDLDLYVTTVGDSRHYLYINYGSAFREEGKLRGASLEFQNKRKLAGTTPSFGDFDNDGYLDMYVGEWIYHFGTGPISASRLLRNKGATNPGYFEDVTDAAGVNMDQEWYSYRNYYSGGTHTFGASFTDLDNDGWVDLIVSGDFGQSRIFWNNRDRTFRKCAESCGLTAYQNAMGHAIADVDNDGRMDWFSSSLRARSCELTGCPFGAGLGGNALFMNQENGTFKNIAQSAGVLDAGWAWGSAFYDFDNNGLLDIVVANGMEIHTTALEDMFNRQNMRFFENNGGVSISYKESALQYNMSYFGGQGRGLALFDYDDDGDEDVFVATNYGPVQVFKNNGGNSKNFLKVKVTHRCPNNPVRFCASYGARVTVTTPNGGKQYAEIGSKTHYLGQSQIQAHFGLGSHAKAEVFVYWPATRQYVKYLDVKANTRLRVVKPDSGPTQDVTSLPRCAQTKLIEIVRQPDMGTLSINPPGIYLKYTLPAGMRAWDVGVQYARYKIGDTSGNTAVADLIFDFRATSPFDCKDGRWTLGQPIPPRTDRRTFSGHYNNLGNVTWGATSESLIRLSPSAYSDGVSQPAATCLPQQITQNTCPYPSLMAGFGSVRPSPREISNVLFAQTGDIFSKRNMSDFTMHYGQFMIHDVDLTTLMQKTEFAYHVNQVWMPIDIPQGDVHFDNANTGKEKMQFVRSVFNRCTGNYPGTTPREQLNKITAYIDGNHLYGSDEARALHLREMKNGRLRMGPALLLPKNTATIANDNPLGRNPQELFIAGDTRANVQPGLTAQHTLYMREHNRLAYAYQLKNPSASDEEIFQAARRMMIAEFQATIYREFLPAILGGDKLPPYTGYKPNVRVDVTTEFSTAAFRFGHSQVNPWLFRLNPDGTTYKDGHALLRETYFQPQRLEREGGLDPMFRGQLYFPAQEVDTFMTDEMRNMLFTTFPHANGKSTGLDLAAINIQRGRDHGIPDFNSVRRSLGLKEYKSFSEITSNRDVALKLSKLYGDVNNIDLWVGGLAENHVPGSEVGETFEKIIIEQFTRIRDGDRYWYQNNMTAEEIEEVHSVSIGKIIRMNTGFTDCPDNVFFSTQHCIGVKDHQCIGRPTKDRAAILAKEKADLLEKNDELDDEKHDYKTAVIVLGVLLGVMTILFLVVSVVAATRGRASKPLSDKESQGSSKAGLSNGKDDITIHAGHVNASYT